MIPFSHHQIAVTLTLLSGVLIGCGTSSTGSTAGQQPEPASVPQESPASAPLEERLATVIAAEDIEEREQVSITRAGTTVLLTGQVLSEAAKSRISNAVAFSGGTELGRLVNELRVVDEMDLDGRERDARLTASVESLLTGSNRPFAGKVQAIVENATVYLLGQVSREEGLQAAELVSRLAGVESVRTVYDYVD